MAENRPQNELDVHEVFDVSGTEPTDRKALDLNSPSDQLWQSEAGYLAAPPMPDTASQGAETRQGQAAGSGRSLSAFSVGHPSKPLLGRLPLARIIPQDVHSVMDYLDGGGVMAGAMLTDCPKAKAASWLMGGSTIAASSVTDYKLSLAKLVPIEAHEAVDYAFGLSAIAAPFVLGYRKTAPHVAALHVAIGIGVIVTSLFTDYRSYRRGGERAAA